MAKKKRFTSSTGDYNIDTGHEKTIVTERELSRGHVFREQKAFEKKVIFADRPAFERRSNDLVRESWSFHSAFPSLRTFVPLLALPFCAWVIAVFRIAIIKPQVLAALSSLFGITMIIAVVFFFIESFKPRFSHAVKDGLIHAAIFILLLFYVGDFNVALNVFLLYVGAHWVMHAIDFHLERAARRGWKLLFYGTVLVFIELVLAANFGL